MRQRSRRPQLLLVGAVLAVNVAVIWYHGDPLQRIAPERATQSDTAPARATQPGESPARTRPTDEGEPPRARGERAAVSGAGVEAFDTAGEVGAYDPTLGLRHPGAVKRVQNVVLREGENAAVALMDAGLPRDDVNGAIASLQQLIDFRRLRPGDRFKARLGEAGDLLSLDLMRDVLDQMRAERADGGWSASRIEVPVDTVVTGITGTVESSLWAALVDQAGETGDLVQAVVDVFAWEIDFYSQVFPGDTFRVLVEKRYSEGRPIGYGDVLAAELVVAGARHRGYVQRSGDADVPPSYYDADGRSLRKQLLKAPLRYGHVTSGFGRRLHPILGYTRSHNGIDYGVPTGTPIWSVGEGRVARAGRYGGYGNFIEIRHANGWASRYGHLSKISVRAGQRVAQKQTIGAVGSTGLATGPHLHYELTKNGGFVNPLTQRFEAGKSLTGAELAAFKARVAELDERLDAIHLALADVPRPDGALGDGPRANSR